MRTRWKSLWEREMMKKLLFSFFLGGAFLVIAACGGTSNSNQANCGPGTYNNGSGACVSDQFNALVNPPNTYWSCGASSAYSLGFIFVATTNTGGTGTFAPGCAGSLESFTWKEANGLPDSIDLTLTTGSGLAPFATFSSIAPNSNNTTFTANGLSALPFSGQAGGCTLITGAMPLTPNTCGH